METFNASDTTPEHEFYNASIRKRPQTKKYPGVKLLVFIFPVFLALIFLGIKIWLPETYKIIVQEDSATEYFQAGFFFLASVFSFLIFKTFFKNRLVVHSVLYGILFLGLSFITLEEISWGQRIFNIENPEFFEENNMQEEISLHNLDKVNNLMSELYIIIGLFGAFGWLAVKVFNLKTRIPYANFYVPRWFLSSCFFFVLFTNALFSYVRPFAVDTLGIEELEIGYFFIYRDQEPAELMLAMGFLLFVVYNYYKLKLMERKNGTVPAGYFTLNKNKMADRVITTKDREPVSGRNRREDIKPQTRRKGN